MNYYILQNEKAAWSIQLIINFSQGFSAQNIISELALK